MIIYDKLYISTANQNFSTGGVGSERGKERCWGVCLSQYLSIGMVYLYKALNLREINL